MKLFTFLTIRQIQKIALTLSLILFFSSPLFAQRGWNHNNSDSTNFKHRPTHRPNDTTYAHRINDSIFLCHRFDTAFVRHVQNWNDTVYFHHHFDTAFAHNWHNRIDSVKHSRFESAFAHRFQRRFDTILARHNWSDTIPGNDTICMNHWVDSITLRHHRNYIIFLHHVRSVINKKGVESDAMAPGSSTTTTTTTIPVSVNIYPNPIGENAVLQIANSSQALSFRLFDITGRVVMSMENLSNGATELNRNNLPPGLYLYQVLNGNSIVSSGKVAIQ